MRQRFNLGLAYCLLQATVDCFQPVQINRFHGTSRTTGRSLRPDATSQGRPASRASRAKTGLLWMLNELPEELELSGLQSTSISPADIPDSVGTQDQEDREKERLESLEDSLAMPWSEVQDRALRDNISKYIIQRPWKQISDASDSESIEAPPERFALWRTMVSEVPGLTGYPIEVVRKQYARQLETSGPEHSALTPGVLPYLDQYSFTPTGGMAGAVFGVAGVAEGAHIQTSPVSSVQVTLPRGFVSTSDGTSAYELGSPSEAASVARSPNTSNTLGFNDMVRKAVNTVSPSDMEISDDTLDRLQVASTFLLTAAVSMSVLSHHLTVSMFWV